jgi:hypothetical protein
LYPLHGNTQRTEVPATLGVTNGFNAQPLQFRMEVSWALAPVGGKTNITLLKPSTPVEIPLPAPNAPMPGALAQRIVFASAAGDQASALMVGDAQTEGNLKGKAFDLSRHRVLALRLRVDEEGRRKGGAPAVLNVQLESSGKRYRDYYVDLDFTGERTILLPEPDGHRMLAEFRPNGANYSFKHAGYTFNYERIVGLNLRWMRLPDGAQVRCRLGLVEALAESKATLANPRLEIAGETLSIPATLESGDYAELKGGNSIRIFDANGTQLQTLSLSKPVPALKSGINSVKLEAESSAPVKITFTTLGPAASAK